MIKLGSVDVPFVFRGSELVYPDYVRDGLVLHYDFSGMTNGDAERGVAEDLSGNGNDGTLQNFNYTVESGYVGDGLKFDGADDGILVGEKEEFNLIEGLTLESTIRVNEYTTGDLISKGTTFGGAQNYSLAVHTNEQVYFEVNDNGERYYTNALLTEFTSDIICIQGVVSKEKMTLYVNGEILGDKIGNIVITPVNSVLGLSFSSNRKYNGNIYSTRIYNRPLTPEEIAHNYQIEKERFNI